MVRNDIRSKVREWLRAPDCPVAGIIKHIRAKNELREVQIEAIETYLFLKIRGENKPLWRLFADGFFTPQIDLQAENINQRAREKMQGSSATLALWHWARTAAPALAARIVNAPDGADYESAAKEIFYGVEYADYLMSLPMGAGKTWLMAAFIYLDLHFARMEPDNPIFARNFLVLVPSGLKSSIVPSLRTIENFDPSWVLPEESAGELRSILRFEVLDRPASAAKSNKTRNPNAHKVNQFMPSPFGCVFVVNAEKVILNRTSIGAQGELIEKSAEEQDVHANELRALLGKIPRLSLLIDEVHHAANGNIKLRQVVNKWCGGGNICTVLGFTGTPYEDGKQKVAGVDVKTSEIANTVYYYPLTTAIEQFLKRPRVERAINLSAKEIVGKAVAAFRRDYEGTVYSGGLKAKMAIYCTSIESLEQEIYPHLTGKLRIPPDGILRYHKGNKEHPVPANSEAEFRNLDSHISKKRYILLVGIGREGWDCRSLTSVVLPQESRSASNTMIVQTACRCLRQAERGRDETALIVLNRQNAITLNERLKKEQQTSIEGINAIGRAGALPLVARHSRVKHLRLPPVEFCQLKVTYHSRRTEDGANTRKKINKLARNINDYHQPATIRISDDLTAFMAADSVTQRIRQTRGEVADYDRWLHDIAKESFGAVTVADLRPFGSQLNRIFSGVTFAGDGGRFYNEQCDVAAVNSRIRLAFAVKRELKSKCEVIPRSAKLLIAEKLTQIADSNKLYPDKDGVAQILEFDAKRMTEQEFESARDARTMKLLKAGRSDEARDELAKKILFATKHRDQSFHYLPHDFAKSVLERDILRGTLGLKEFRERKLEIYYNGDRKLTEFVIDCHAQEGGKWRSIGKYTPDFLIVRRKGGKIHKALIVETKGAVFAADPRFQQRRKFMDSAFLRENNAKFGYKKFDFLLIMDDRSEEVNLARIGAKITGFFTED